MIKDYHCNMEHKSPCGFHNIHIWELLDKYYEKITFYVLFIFQQLKKTKPNNSHLTCQKCVVFPEHVMWCSSNKD